MVSENGLIRSVNETFSQMIIAPMGLVRARRLYWQYVSRFSLPLKCEMGLRRKLICSEISSKQSLSPSRSLICKFRDILARSLIGRRSPVTVKEFHEFVLPNKFVNLPYYSTPSVDVGPLS